MSIVDSKALKLHFSKEEVFSALSSLWTEWLRHSLLAVCKNFVKDEMMAFFAEFHDLGSFERSLNTIFLVLILNKQGPGDLKDFRSISLVEGL